MSSEQQPIQSTGGTPDLFIPALIALGILVVVGSLLFHYYSLFWKPPRLREARRQKLLDNPYSKMSEHARLHYQKHAWKLLEHDTSNPSMWHQLLDASGDSLLALENEHADTGLDSKLLTELYSCATYWQLLQLYQRHPGSTGDLNDYLGRVYYEGYKARKYKNYRL